MAQPAKPSTSPDQCRDYPEKVSGSDIYTAVVERGAHTLDEL